MNTFSRQRWLRRIRPSTPARIRLVCCPPAGSGAFFYRNWADLIPASVDVMVVQYPGRDDRMNDPFATDLSTMADDIADAVPDDNMPLALFGHSMGAAVAYEVARRLEPRGVEHLLVSGRPPAHRQRVKTIHQRDDNAIMDEIARLGGTPDAVLNSDALCDVLIPRIRADFRLIETYAPPQAAPLNIPVTAFIGREDTEVTPDEAASWADVSTGAFALQTYPGGHFYLTERPGPFIRDLTKRLNTAIWPSTP